MTLVGLCTMALQLQAQKPCCLHLKNGELKVFYTDQVDSLTVATTADSEVAPAQTLRVWTDNKMYPYAVADIDSLSFTLNPIAGKPQVESLESTFAIVRCSFKYVPKGAVCGITYSTGTGNAMRLIEVAADGEHRVVLSGLQDHTTYAYQAFVMWEGKTVRGEKAEFTTLERNRAADADLCVDMGLSVKWAKCNLGARAAEESGYYFAWGETAPKNTYVLENSLTAEASLSSIAGDAQYDAATANWGEGACLPTQNEMSELVNNCTTEWTELNGIKGRLLTSKINGNTLFLPAPGCRGDASLFLEGQGGYYWGANAYADGLAYSLDLSGIFFGRDWSCRDYGHTIRPVHK